MYSYFYFTLEKYIAVHMLYKTRTSYVRAHATTLDIELLLTMCRTENKYVVQ